MISVSTEAAVITTPYFRTVSVFPTRADCISRTTSAVLRLLKEPRSTDSSVTLLANSAALSRANPIGTKVSCKTDAYSIKSNRLRFAASAWVFAQASTSLDNSPKTVSNLPCISSTSLAAFMLETETAVKAPPRTVIPRPMLFRCFSKPAAIPPILV